MKENNEVDLHGWMSKPTLANDIGAVGQQAVELGFPIYLNFQQLKFANLIVFECISFSEMNTYENDPYYLYYINSKCA